MKVKEMRREALRDSYGLALVELGKEMAEVVVLDADVSKSTKTCYFQDAFPERFTNFGIAEQNMMAAAAGMATVGLVPFVNTFAFLATYRAADQFRTSIVYPRLNVKVAASYAGLSDSFDGPTHQTVSDIAAVRALPGLCIIVPSDAVELRKALPVLARHNGPVWLRLCRAETPVFHVADYEFRLGKADKLRDGKDVAIIATGVAVPRVLEAVEEMVRRGHDPLVLSMPTVKPFDADAVIKAAAQTGAVVTVEEHSIIGGLGSAVCEVLGGAYPVSVERLGFPDTFAESGPYDDLLDRYGLSVNGILRAAENAIRRRSS
jgi:transketolase